MAGTPAAIFYIRLNASMIKQKKDLAGTQLDGSRYHP